ncbi:Aste57867_21178 [Aphanomyces stellatus]|uniref:Aste57867_21178 protein n=1 Tax=Aphanomyces stellatus TaxID=120398 RepID=A0A485LIA3_9STRA|nr:hypothetical protein As57867_021110 [Aphanomyces stellatus]VFT97852.1 Aste57867_21178 [Aphanomyces stellatus]
MPAPAPLLRSPPTVVPVWTFSRSQYIVSFAGILYLGGSLVSSFWYATVLAPSMTNDFWWLDFNASVQVFLLNAMNALHAVDVVNKDPIDLASPFFAQDAAASATVTNNPTYPRSILYSTLTDPAAAIAACRSTPAMGLVWVITQNCWVDFARHWEVAHTAARQTRCRDQYATNGAVYMESILRNTDMKQWMVALGAPGAEFDVGVVRFLQQSDAGRLFLADVARSWLAVADEVVYWASSNVTFWKTQFQNIHQTGIQESIVLHSAFGGTHALSTVVLPYYLRQVLWTTVNMGCGFYCDLWYAQDVGASLVRNDAAQFWGNVVDIEMLLLGTEAMTLAQVVVHTCVGAIDSIDLDLVAVPAAAKALYFSFTVALHAALLDSPSLADLYAAIAPLSVVPALPQWTTVPAIQFLGGSPLCTAGPSMPFIQREWGFDDGCDASVPLTVEVTSQHLLFAMVGYFNTPSMSTAPSVLSIEALTAAVCPQTTSPSTCGLSLAQAHRLYMLVLASAIAPAVVWNASTALPPLEVIQMAHATTSSPLLLRQPLVATADPVFAFFGWTCVLDWVQGTREVVSFQGDVTTLTLISYAYDLSNDGSTPSSDQVPRSIGLLFANGVWYVSTVLALAAGCMVGVAAFYSFQISGHNLFYFNRVAGPIWVGRPLLFLRGLTAIILLSSASPRLVVRHGLKTMANVPRTFLESLVVASESTWITYVLSDVSLVVTKGSATAGAPVASAFMFVLALALDTWTPLAVQVHMSRACSVLFVDHTVLCSTNVVQIGNLPRVLCLVAANAVAVVGSYLLVRLCHVMAHTAPRQLPDSYLLYPESSLVFFEQLVRHTASSEWWIDAASNVMCGMVLFTVRHTNYVFDVKSWHLVKLPASQFRRRGSVSMFAAPVLAKDRSTSIVAPDPPPHHPPLLMSSPTVEDLPLPHSSWPSLALITSFAYIVATLAGSICYLMVLEQKMSNDFWWNGFNSTGGHRFLATLLAHPPPDGRMDLTQYALVGTFNGSDDSIAYAPGYVYDVEATVLNEIPLAIAGLRQMDGCEVPWIATQYCWVDFKRQWELANSRVRQDRCHVHATTNAAVYLESVLRNVNLAQFETCWGVAFNWAIGDHLRQSDSGRAWLTSTWGARMGSEASEVAYWQLYDLTEFVGQWQNYYLVGLTETIGVQNSFGATYPLTIKRSESVWRLQDETTFKMYWILAGDLWAIGFNNASGVASGSLVRTSANFVYHNTTPRHVLQVNGSLPSPLGWTALLVEQYLGPYGSVDIKHVPIPVTATQLILPFVQRISLMLFASPTALSAYNHLPDQLYMNTIPMAWQSYNFLGGSPLCFDATTDKGYLCPFVNTLAPCQSNSVQEAYHMARDEGLLAAAMASIRDATTNASVCQYATQKVTCSKALSSYPTFVTAFLGNLTALQAEARSILRHVQGLNVSLFQFVSTKTGQQLLVTANAFSDGDWAFWSWSYLYHWALGSRDVLSFEGDVDTITVLSGFTRPYLATTNPAEIPHSLSLYFTVAIQYVTMVLLSIATLVVVYVVVHRGRVEAWNLIKINRVGGIVWIGRPLLMLRATSAICLLSTSELLLAQRGGNMTKFQRDDLTGLSVVQTILISGEVCWLTYILNDVFSVVTKGYTRRYAALSSILVWSITALLQLAAPLTVQATLARSCARVNLDVVCTVGTIQVGSVMRSTTLVWLSYACIAAAFAVQATRRARTPPASVPSLFLYSLGGYTFYFDEWTLDNVVYLDKASAFLNGLVVVDYANVLYLLDVKTWRSYAIPKPKLEEVRWSTRLVDCLPLMPQT